MNNNWIHSVSAAYLTEVVKIKKPKVLLTALEGQWNLKEKDLTELKKVSDLTVRFFTKKDRMTEKKLAEMCNGYNHLMLNADFLPMQFYSKTNTCKISPEFYQYDSVKQLDAFNIDYTDADLFSPVSAAKNKIIIQTCLDAATRSVAESVVAEILIHAKKRVLDYTKEEYSNIGITKTIKNMSKSTVGIVGFGNIGRTCYSILSGFGCKFLVNDVRSFPGVTNTPLEELFKKSNIIIIQIPSIDGRRNNHSNVGMVDETLLNKCSDAIITNLATDYIVNRKHMCRAIQNGNVSGYSTEDLHAESATESTRKIFENFPQVHVCKSNAFDTQESRDAVKKIWINNTVSGVQGNLINVWGTG